MDFTTENPVSSSDDSNNDSSSDPFDGYLSSSSLSEPPSVIHTPKFDIDFMDIDDADASGGLCQEEMMDMWLGAVDKKSQELRNNSSSVVQDKQIVQHLGNVDRPHLRAFSVDATLERAVRDIEHTLNLGRSVSVPAIGSNPGDMQTVFVIADPGNNKEVEVDDQSRHDQPGSDETVRNQAVHIQAFDKEELDSRINPSSLVFSDGIWMIPRGCQECLIVRQFCDRGSPCSRCLKFGKNCARNDGLVAAGPRQKRSLRDSNSAPQAPQKRPVKSEDTENDNHSPKKRGRPKGMKPEVIERPKTKIKAVIPIDPQGDKPVGIGLPEIWCETRQELCEGLPYYRAYQSGCYTHEGLVHGYLLDACDSIRDHIGGKILISHSGGKSKEDEDTGIRSLTTHQSIKDTTIKCLLNNKAYKFPIAIIIGNRSTASPTQIPHRYCVMDWFKVTHAWAEKCPLSGYVRWKFRFEKLDFANDGWWAAEKSAITDEVVSMASCIYCKKESPHIYQEGWMCLDPTCARFWKIDGIDEPVELTYTSSFLNAKTHWEPELEVPPTILRPVVNSEWDNMFEAQDVSRKAWKGFCCPDCGRLSCREHWDRWECANQSCGFKLYPKQRTIFQAAKLADPHRPVFTGPAIPQDTFGDEIKCTRSVLNGFTVVQYELGDCGTVTHMLANQLTNSQELGADWLLENYQRADLPFRRYKLHTQQGVTRTSHFTYNVGAQYNYVADQPTVTFEEADPVVKRALELLEQRVKMIYQGVSFNEVLNVGYFESQRMNYHQDGERGLGPTVASISLGCPALMKFRIKANRNAVRYIEGNNDEGIKQPAVRLTLKLHHGDIMIMHGEAIQTVWEHAAQPLGLFRIAATARWIGAENHTTAPRINTEPLEHENTSFVKKEPIEDFMGSHDPVPASDSPPVVPMN